MPGRGPVRVVPAPWAAGGRHIGLHQLLHHLQTGAHGQGQQPLPHLGGDLLHRHRHLLRHGQRPRVERSSLVVLGHSGPLFVGLSWRTPNTYLTAGLERGTATSSSTRAGTTFVTVHGAANEGAAKVSHIQAQLGRRPVVAAGNSGGDREMLEWVTAADRPTLALLVDHDDAEREFSYTSRAETVAEPEPITDVAHRQGWTVISMANDWDTIFAAEQ